jgi:hypothetical protein
MPLWLRKFTFSKIKGWYDQQAKAQEMADNGGKTMIDLNNPDKSKLPDISKKKAPPTYATKMSKS